MNNNNNQKKSSSKDEEEEEEEVALPGFRFHPTDEELVGFYLRRKVDKKPLSIELIKQVDIYKFDPWDLPKGSSSGGEKEGYFFCKRGRKYRNSIRPNRVTGSGFWKATGIDKPVYSSHGDSIGLKKTLVYYRGSAGKGTKTDWMMHEFRLPSNDTTIPHASTAHDVTAAKSSPTEAEVWTLCRIFKRNVSHRRYTPDWRELSSKREAAAANMDTSSITCSVDSSITRENYLCFGAPLTQYNDKKPVTFNHLNDRKLQLHHHSLVDQLTNISQQQQQQPPSMASSPNISSPPYGNQLFGYGDWDELRSVVEFALDPSHL